MLKRMSKIKHLYGLYHSIYILILLIMTCVEEIGHWLHDSSDEESLVSLILMYYTR